MTSALEAGKASCHTCMALNDAAAHHCRRCGSLIHPRIPNSIQRTVALLIAAAVMYVPANTFPIMTMDQFGTPVDSTILGGVVSLWKMGSYGVAVVILIASVLIPIAKILSIAALCWTITIGPDVSHTQRAVLYRITDFIGKYSMVDVFVVAVLVALIQLSAILVVRPGPAALAFSAVVVLTMLAAHQFDPRLIWDHGTRLRRKHG